MRDSSDSVIQSTLVNNIYTKDSKMRILCLHGRGSNNEVRSLSLSLLKPNFLQITYSGCSRYSNFKLVRNVHSRFGLSSDLTNEREKAAIRADLDDMEFEFVQGTVLHTEGARELYCNAKSTVADRRVAD